MIDFKICRDLEEGRCLWVKHWPMQCVFDLWDLRSCFQKGFDRPPLFIIAEKNGSLCGFLALSWIEEQRCYGHFPGETWNGKTWLEQNRIIASDSRIFQELLDRIPGPAFIRYLSPDSLGVSGWSAETDETGYVFHPRLYAYAYEDYLQHFKGKSRKKIFRELSHLSDFGISFRYDCLKDIDDLFIINLQNFGANSYFNDFRFLKSFENLIEWLHQNGMLRITTALIGGKTAAVDIGAVWGSSYTVLAGGAHSDYPGIAKLINLHHIEWSCRKRFETVDFLCGDFGWKNRFHLSPRPLFLIDRKAPETVAYYSPHVRFQSIYA